MISRNIQGIDRAGKKNHSEFGNPGPERQASYVLTCKWLLTFK